MSYAATHKHHHVQVPWMTVIAVAVAAAVAAAVLILVNQPATQTATGPAEVVPIAVSVDAAAVPLPESPAFRRHLATEVSAQISQGEQFAYPRNHVIGTTLDAAGTPATVTGGLAIEAAPNDPHPFNHFPGEP